MHDISHCAPPSPFTTRLGLNCFLGRRVWAWKVHSNQHYFRAKFIYSQVAMELILLSQRTLATMKLLIQLILVAGVAYVTSSTAHDGKFS